MKRPFISLTSDFGVGSQGIGVMRGVALKINPEAIVIDLMHGLPSFDVTSGAYIMETAVSLPIGYHVCVVDPGVGTKRKGIIIQTKRGDFLIGPDNGVLIPASERFLGGIVKAVEITNEKYMNKPVSPVFHGRDVFTPAAAWLSRGIRIEEFGPEIPKEKLVPAPYPEARVSKGLVEGEIIHINHFGNLFVNVLIKNFEKSGIKYRDGVLIGLKGKKIQTKFLKTFGEVPIGEPVICPDDYGRVEIALNQGRFADKYRVKLRDKLKIRKL
jgi:hypothetical protein